MRTIRDEAQRRAEKDGITLTTLHLPGRMAEAYGYERYAHQFLEHKLAPILEYKLSPDALAAMQANHAGACVVEEGSWIKGKQPTYTTYNNFHDALTHCEDVAKRYLHAQGVSTNKLTSEVEFYHPKNTIEKEALPMATQTANEQQQAQNQKEPSVFQQARDWLNSTWLVKAVYNDYTAGAVADVRRRGVEEGWYGKTLDDTVNRQSYGEFKKNAVQGEETGPRWKTDKEFDAWFDAKMAQHRPDYSPDKFFGRDQDQQQNQHQGKSQGMER